MISRTGFVLFALLIFSFKTAIPAKAVCSGPTCNSCNCNVVTTNHTYQCWFTNVEPIDPFEACTPTINVDCSCDPPPCVPNACNSGGSHCAAYSNGCSATGCPAGLTCGGDLQCISDSCSCPLTGAGHTQCQSGTSCIAPQCIQQPCPDYSCGNPPDRQQQEICGGCGRYVTTCQGVCKECGCTRQCGQVGPNCGGTCPSGNECTNPNPPTSQSPNNAIGSPLILANPTVNLSWQDAANTAPPSNFDQYIVKVDTVLAGSLPKTQHLLAFSDTSGLRVGHVYNWTVQSYKSANCAGVGGGCGADGYSTAVGGNFCYQVTPGATSMINANGASAAAPYPFPNSDTASLQWNLTETNHSATSGYQLQIYNASNLGTSLVDTTTLATVGTYSFTGSKGNIYYWKVRAFSPMCDGTKNYGAWVDGYFVLASIPTFADYSFYTVSNTVAGGGYLDGTLLPLQDTGMGYSGNHSCTGTSIDSAYPRRVGFRVGIVDNSLSSLSEVKMRLVDTSNNSTVATFGISGLDGVKAYNISAPAGVSTYESEHVIAVGTTETRVIFPIDFAIDTNLSPKNYQIEVWAKNIYGLETLSGSWVNTGYRVKIWDCKVAITGILHDASLQSNQGAICSQYKDLPGFGKLTFTSLKFLKVAGATSIPTDITVDPNTINSIAGTFSTNLLWGRYYQPEFNSDLDAENPTNNPAAVVDLSDPTKVLTCKDNAQIWPNNFAANGYTNSSLNPYSTTVGAVVHFKTKKNFMGWYNVKGSGIVAKTSLSYAIPPTCAVASGCVEPVLVSNSLSPKSESGFVSGASLVNNAGCESGVCSFGDTTTGRDWSASKNLIRNIPSYDELLKYFYSRLGLGTVMPGGGDFTTFGLYGLPTGEGIYFTDGDFNVDASNVVALNKLLLIVAKGNINVASDVTNLDGIFVAGGNINITGESRTQLKINGMLAAKGNISITRSLVDALGSHLDNNTKPAVTFTYRPDMLFALPSSVGFKLQGWQEGGN